MSDQGPEQGAPQPQGGRPSTEPRRWDFSVPGWNQQSSGGQPAGQQAPVGAAPYGGSPYGPPPVGQSPSGQPQVGQSPSGQPQVGQSPSGQPQVGQSPYGQPPVGQPPYGPPPVGQPPYGQRPGGPYGRSTPSPYGASAYSGQSSAVPTRPFAVQPYGVYPPSRSRTPLVVIAAVVAGVLVLGGLVAAAVGVHASVQAASRPGPVAIGGSAASRPGASATPAPGAAGAAPGTSAAPGAAAAPSAAASDAHVQALVRDGVATLQRQQTFPRQVDRITTVESVAADGDDILYTYAISSDVTPDAVMQSDLHRTITSKLCGAPSTRLLLDEGVGFRYHYEFTGSGATADVTVTDADC